MNSVSHAYMSYGSVNSPSEKDAFNEILEDENSNNTCTETATRCHMVRPHPEKITAFLIMYHLMLQGMRTS